jgi:hypothetical protein
LLRQGIYLEPQGLACIWCRKQLKASMTMIFFIMMSTMWEIFDRLQRNPDDLYDAIENTYEWSKKVHIRTGLIAKYLPKVLIKIGELELC